MASLLRSGSWFVVAGCLLFAFGCAPDKPQAKLTDQQKLQNMSSMIDNDPNASPEAKKFANSALNKVRSDNQVWDAASGKN